MNRSKARDMDIILASASPRRRELLQQIGIGFQTLVSNAEETIEETAPDRLVEELSARKAEACLELIQARKKAETGASDSDFGEGFRALLVIGADTAVSAGGRILGKPRDESEAAAMLKAQQGQATEVYTGVTLLYCPKGLQPPREYKNTEEDASHVPGMIKKTFYECTTVYFYPMSDEEIQAYVATGEPLDKAGGYGIQGSFAKYIRRIEGDYSNVVGLPVARLYQEAKEWLTAERQEEGHGGKKSGNL